jgi:hypothetical protein
MDNLTPEQVALAEKELPRNPTVKELDDLVEAIFDQKAKIEEMNEAVSKENVALQRLEAKAVAYLEELGRETYKTARGTLGVKENWRFNLPQSDEDKLKFFNYLREKGVYDKYATVHSSAYNAFCKAEWEAAQAEGKGMDFSLPGVPEPKLYKGLTTRKGK